MDISMASGSSIDRRHPHSPWVSNGLWWQQRPQMVVCPLDVAWIMGTNMVSGAAPTVEDFQEIQYRKWTVLHLGHSVVGLNQNDGVSPGCCTPSCRPYSVSRCSPIHCISHTHHCLILPLSIAYIAPFSIFPTSPLCICLLRWHCKLEYKYAHLLAFDASHLKAHQA